MSRILLLLLLVSGASAAVGVLLGYQLSACKCEDCEGLKALGYVG